MADNPVSLLDALRAHHPPIAVMGLTATFGTSLVRHIVDRQPETKLVVIGTDTDSSIVHELMDFGCQAFVGLARVTEELTRAMCASVEGRKYVSTPHSRGLSQDQE